MGEKDTNCLTDDKSESQIIQKMKRRERTKICILVCLVIILIGALVAMVTLYINKTCEKSETASMSSKIMSTEADTFKKQAVVKNVPELNINFVNQTDVEKVPELDTNFVNQTDVEKVPELNINFVNQTDVEKVPELDTNFVITFKKRTVENIPELRRVIFPATDEFSICFWFKMDNASTDGLMAFFMYTTVDIDGENDLMLWIQKERLLAWVRNKEINVLFHHFPKGTWSHLCWMWKSNGTFWVFKDGKLVKTSISAKEKYRKPLPESSGNVILGQDKDGDRINDSKQMFHGSITQFFIFSKLLTEDEVVSAYKNRPPNDSIVVGWWQFKNMTRGNDIVERALPSDFQI